MPANKHKSGKRRYRQGHQACLWEWLAHAPEECWTLNPRQYREEKKEMFVLAGLRPMVLKTEQERAKARQLKNVWRHSCTSFLLAHLKDPMAVAYLLQHTRPTTTSDHYEGIADEQDAARFFAITPRSVLLTWEEFCARTVLKRKEPSNPPFQFA